MRLFNSSSDTAGLASCHLIHSFAVLMFCLLVFDYHSRVIVRSLGRLVCRWLYSSRDASSEDKCRSRARCGAAGSSADILFFAFEIYYGYRSFSVSCSAAVRMACTPSSCLFILFL
jgi:hypothetical protein